MNQNPETKDPRDGFMSRIRTSMREFFKSKAAAFVTRGIRLAPSGKHAKQRRNARVWTPAKRPDQRHVCGPVRPLNLTRSQTPRTCDRWERRHNSVRGMGMRKRQAYLATQRSIIGNQK